MAGIAHWINTYYKLPAEKHVDKTSELVKNIKTWVDAEYAAGRVTVLTDDELVDIIEKECNKLRISLK